jgi:transposase InsO family protein
MWQSDCMHGPQVAFENRLRKAYLFAVIDDHSRLVTHAQFYLSESLDCFRDCLISALEKRGLPRRLYVDYAEEKQMPKFVSIFPASKEMASRTSA